MARNPWPTATGAARDCGRLVGSAACPSDELPSASGPGSVRPGRDSAGRFQPGNSYGSAKRFRAGQHGALTALERQGDEAARASLAFGRRYAAHRRAELTAAHGAISAGVGAMVESAGELLASARYWSARGLAEANPDFARLAATLIAGQRQAERDAWELASREAQARPRENPIDRLRREMAATRRARELAAAPTTENPSAPNAPQQGAEEPSG
ncbi:MAG: hypothetical protein JW940_00480 [Polyangiaceae bacterium]|nr:hypothetical protein [Polyangiaceae bacterium]